VKTLVLFFIALLSSVALGSNFQVAWTQISLKDQLGTSVQIEVGADNQELDRMDIVLDNGMECHPPSELIDSVVRVDLSKTQIVYSTSPINLETYSLPRKIVKISLGLFEFNSESSSRSNQYRVDFIIEDCQFERWFRLEVDGPDSFFDEGGNEIMRYEVLN